MDALEMSLFQYSIQATVELRFARTDTRKTLKRAIKSAPISRALQNYRAPVANDR